MHSQNLEGKGRFTQEKCGYVISLSRQKYANNWGLKILNSYNAFETAFYSALFVAFDSI